ncbi:head maturation protease, ClpP-related [Polaromonas jejuensis]|uniref:ATP-dependent Clp protease proteolytic subunit n=1 Tax=Polaromonas jejuensis TaxID=457502 RepID=A0ABW0QGF4_9BURK|nr:head maturation protease, ClpP-related [Polaromonas jejuensis]
MNKLLKLLASNRRQAQPRALAVEGDETTIYLYDIIVSDDLTADWGGGVSAQTLVSQIRGIKGGTIHLRINSPGGEVPAAQAIVAAIRDTGAKVIAHVEGLAASAATLVAIAADEVEISEGSLFMIHCAQTIAYGNASDFLETVALLEKADGIISDQYAAKTGQPAEAMRALMDAETWFTAQEAVDAGFVDRITPNVKAATRWDLSAYAKAPQQAPEPEPRAAQKPEQTKTITNDHRERQQQRLRMLNRLTHQ